MHFQRHVGSNTAITSPLTIYILPVVIPLIYLTELSV